MIALTCHTEQASLSSSCLLFITPSLSLSHCSPSLVCSLPHLFLLFSSLSHSLFLIFVCSYLLSLSVPHLCLLLLSLTLCSSSLSVLTFSHSLFLISVCSSLLLLSDPHLCLFFTSLFLSVPQLSGCSQLLSLSVPYLAACSPPPFSICLSPISL